MKRKYFNILRGITMASALRGTEKEDVLKFINKIEGSLKSDEPNRLER